MGTGPYLYYRSFGSIFYFVCAFGSGSRNAKIIHKQVKSEPKNYMLWNHGCPLWRTGGFSWRSSKPGSGSESGFPKTLGYGSGCNRIRTNTGNYAWHCKVIVFSDRTLRFGHCRFLSLGTLFCGIVKEDSNFENCSFPLLGMARASVLDPGHFGVDPDPCSWIMDPDPAILSLTFLRVPHIYIIFQRLKVRNKSSVPDPYLWLMDPDPEGPKTRGSGSGTLGRAVSEEVRMRDPQSTCPPRSGSAGSCPASTSSTTS